MRILFSCATFDIGGFSSHAINLSKYLREHGLWTGVLVTDPFGSLYDEFKNNFDEIFIVSRGLEGRQKYLKRIIGTIKNINPNVIINNGVQFIQAAYPYLPYPIVKLSIIHSINPSEIITGTACKEYVDRIVVVAQNIRNAATKYCEDILIEHIPIGIQIDNLPTPAHIFGDKIKLVYIGRVTKVAKNLKIIEAIAEELYKRGAPYELTIIGDGDYKAVMEINLNKKAFAQKICFLGALPPKEIAKILTHFDMLLLCSTYEGMPHVILETMAYGIIPIVSRIPGSTDTIIEDGVDGFLCETNNVQQYIDKILLLWSDKEKCQKLSITASYKVKDRYSVDVIAEQYLKLFKIKHQKKDTKSIIKIDESLLPYCHSFFRHIRRLAGDFYRSLFWGIRRVNKNDAK